MKKSILALVLAFMMVASSCSFIFNESVDIELYRGAEAGLYETGSDKLILSWDELISEEIVFVDNGVLYTNIDFDTMTSKSADLLDGILVIPDGVTALGDYNVESGEGHIAFAGCEKLIGVVIPDSVTSIGPGAFGSCFSLEGVAIGNGVTSIGDAAFYGCMSLTDVTIPDSVTSIGDTAFFCCESLTSVTFKGTVTEWNEVSLGGDWNHNVPATEVICSDGAVSL